MEQILIKKGKSGKLNYLIPNGLTGKQLRKILRVYAKQVSQLTENQSIVVTIQ